MLRIQHLAMMALVTTDRILPIPIIHDDLRDDCDATHYSVDVESRTADLRTVSERRWVSLYAMNGSGLKATLQLVLKAVFDVTVSPG